MTYIISTATYTEHFGLYPAEYREATLGWSARESFDEVCSHADPAGTWQTWWKVDDQDKARAEMDRIRATEHGLTEAFKSPITGFIGYKETAFKLEWLNDDTGDVELLDWIAEGFEHEPEDEGSEE
jgi:hypothetical protein